MSVRVGTSGWGRPDWVGPFYPVHLRARPEDWLAHYATRFRTVEVTSTFDAFPDEALVDSWARSGVALSERAPFEFSLKLPRGVTHEALPAGDVELARAETGRFDREVLDPLAGEGLLGAVLVQLPPGYVAVEDHVGAVGEVLAALAERRVALELRDPSWVHDGCVAPVAERLFASRDVCLAEVDLPGAPGVVPPVDARHAYVRLHGRRDDVWAHAAHDGERYDYLYAREALAPWARRARTHEERGRDVRVYLNNAPRAQSVANAVDVMELLGAPAPARPRLTAQQRLPL